jgi:hypothetical protein
MTVAAKPATLPRPLYEFISKSPHSDSDSGWIGLDNPNFGCDDGFLDYASRSNVERFLRGHTLTSLTAAEWNIMRDYLIDEGGTLDPSLRSIEICVI